VAAASIAWVSGAPTAKLSKTTRLPAAGSCRITRSPSATVTGSFGGAGKNVSRRPRNEALGSPILFSRRCTLQSKAMQLSAGQFLGPYKIVAPLGAGGMGEVYRALDTRLERSVALKILRSESNDLGRQTVLARFEREARTISSLNHPNIC